jgi:hypothetical protein
LEAEVSGRRVEGWVVLVAWEAAVGEGLQIRVMSFANAEAWAGVILPAEE